MIEHHRAAAYRTWLRATHALHALVERASADERHSKLLRLVFSVNVERRQGDEITMASIGPFAHEGAGEGTDVVYANVPGLPSFALDKPTFRPLLQLEIDVAVGTVLATSLADGPTLPTVHLPDQPFELFRTQQAEVCGPLEEASPVTRSQLLEEPGEAEEGGEGHTHEIRVDKPGRVPIQDDRNKQAEDGIQQRGGDRHDSSREPGHVPS